MRPIAPISESLRRLIASPVDELGRGQRRLRYMVDLTRHCIAELRHDRAAEMAAALTYRTIFSLVPVFVLSLLVFNAFGGFKDTGKQLQEKMYGYLGLNTLTASASDTPSDLRVKLDEIVNNLTTQASNLSYKSIGLVGLVVLIWAGLALLITIERSFNRIYDCPTGRPWRFRIPIYWAVVTLGPVLVFLSLYLTTYVLEYVTNMGPFSELVRFGSLFGPLAASWLLLFLLFTLMPNTRVFRRSALLGSFITAVLYEAGKVGFQFYVHKALPYSKVYGAIGLVPLFLFWVYLTWLIVLFGLELTYTLQAMKGRRFKHMEKTVTDDLTGDPRWLIPIAAHIGQAFETGKPLTLTQLSEALGLSPVAIAALTQRLHHAGLVHHVQLDGDTEPGLTLALPPDKIPLRQLLDLAHGMTVGAVEHRNPLGWAYLDKLHRAQTAVAETATLATLLTES